MDKTRVVLVGCGGISRAWMGPISKRGDIEVVGFVDLNEEAARKLAKEFESDAAVGVDLAGMLAELKPDAVFDCTLPEAHVTVTLAALEHGCHVLGEKPLADTMDNARKMVAAARDSGKTYAVIQNRRYQANIRALRRFIESGAIGRLSTVHSDFFIGAHFGGFRDEMEHVLLLDMAIHTFDAARLITGQQPVSALCHEWNPAGSWYHHGASAMALFEMSEDVVYCYRGSWCAEGRNTSWESSWRMVGEKGTITWDGGTDFAVETVVGSEGFIREVKAMELPCEDTPLAGGEGHAGVIDDFLRCIREGGCPETVCTDNIKSLAMVHAAIESAQAGRRVRIEV